MATSRCRSVLVVAALAAFCPNAGAAPNGPNGKPLWKDGEVIVKFRDGSARLRMQASVAGALGAAGRLRGGATIAGALVKTLALVGRPETGLVRFSRGASVEEMVAAFRSLPEVEYAEPNYMVYLPAYVPSRGPAPMMAVPAKGGGLTVDKSKAALPAFAALLDGVHAFGELYPSDPLVGKQVVFSANEVWAIWPDKAANPMVAVIDTGVDYNHPDLKGRVVKGHDWINGDTDPMDDNGHGTHCAGNVAAIGNNNIGITGVSTAKVLAIKVLGVAGDGTNFDVANGVLEAANNPLVKVLSLSLGGASTDATLKSAVQTAVDNGKLVVVAAGNDNTDTYSYPAAYADTTNPAFSTLSGSVMAVAATGNKSYSTPSSYYIDYNCKAPYSNFGPWISIVAPGTSILSTTPIGDFYDNWYFGTPKSYATLDGTSMATPIVAGAAARTFSAMPAGTTAADVKTRLMSTGLGVVAYGEGHSIDTDGNGSLDTPCWDPLGTTPNTVNFVSVAEAMQRALVQMGVYQANGRLPLNGAKVTVNAGATPKGIGGTVGADFEGAAIVLDVPFGGPYTVSVNAAGYTAGSQAIWTTSPTRSYWGVQDVSFAKMAAGKVHVITDWGFFSSPLQVDQFLFTPSGSSAPGSIGRPGPTTLGAGSLVSLPFARWLFDGQGRSSTELTTIGTFLTAPSGSTPYKVFLTDTTGDSSNLWTYNFITTRIWSAGKIIGVTNVFDADPDTNNCTIHGGGTACDVLYVGDINSPTSFTPQNVFGVGTASGPGAVYPYSFRSRVKASGAGQATGAPQTR